VISKEKVIHGGGAPVRLIPRKGEGLLILQGSSYLVMSRPELEELVSALQEHFKELDRPRIQRFVGGKEQPL